MTAAPPTLDTLLRRTAAEIRHCRAMVTRLEDTVHDLVEGGIGDTGPLQELQAIDRLGQRLDDLVRWTEGLAASTTGTSAGRSLADLARPLLLAEMRQALAGAPAGAGQISGQIDMF